MDLEPGRLWSIPIYDRWIEMYAADDFAEVARWCREICDRAAADAAPATRERMQDAFVISSRHELAFWEAAWRSTSWETAERKVTP
jgi:thiaminase/transcriptional activator TenA